jgi:hypothetical protein
MGLLCPRRYVCALGSSLCERTSQLRTAYSRRPSAAVCSPPFTWPLHQHHQPHTHTTGSDVLSLLEHAQHQRTDPWSTPHLIYK